MKRRRRPYRPPRARAEQKTPVRRTRSNGAVSPLTPALIRTVICGALFVTLVALKLLLPGRLAALRGTLGTWLARDADFAAAFSAVGHAVSGEGGVLDSLEDAYVAVFGPQEAAEVSGASELDAPSAEPAGAARPVETAEPTEETPPETRETQDTQDTQDAPRSLGFDYAAPLRGKVTSGYGMREHPATGCEAFHYGVDIAADEGTEIDCFADGTVGVVADGAELGKYLTVYHENGVTTLYGHCSRITVSPGDVVQRGSKLAEVGSTGNATGPHLHFELHDGKDYLDPEPYLS